MATVAPSDWQLHLSKEKSMDVPAANNANARQRTSPANDHQAHPQQLHQHLPHHPPYSYPLQQQPQGSWTPSIAAAPFYPSFYQNHQPQSPQTYPSQLPHQPPYFDPANAQLAQWAYQQMMFNAQHGFAQQQRTPGNDYYAQNQLTSSFNPFPSGTPPPPPHRNQHDHSQQLTQPGQFGGFHPYRRPNRQPTSDAGDWRSGTSGAPYPPYGRPEASGSTSSVNSSSSQRQRTNSNQSGKSGHTNPPSANGSIRGRNQSLSGQSSSSNRSAPSPKSSPPSTPATQLRVPHHRNSSASSSGSTTRPGISPPPPSSTTTTSSATASSTSNTLSISTPIPRPARPSPLSQGNFIAEKRMSRDDSALDPAPTSSMLRSGGLKGRLRRALSFSPSHTLNEDDPSDDESIKATIYGGSSKSKPKAPAVISSAVAKANGTGGVSGIGASTDSGDDAASTATVQTKKKGRAASLFNSRLNASTDNISLSSTVSSASVMIRKLGSMGKLARRNSLAGITSLFKDKDKNKDKDDKKGKKDKKSGKAEASEASVSHVTAELDRIGGDWTVGADMKGLSPAAKLARQHTLKSNAEAAAKAKAQREATNAAPVDTNADGISGAAVAVWDRNTATRQGSLSPVKGGGGIRVNEDGTRVLVEDEDDPSDDGHYAPQQAGQSSHTDGWVEDDDWEDGGDLGDEDTTIRVGLERTSLDEGTSGDHEPWAVNVRRSIEKARRPSKGILKYAESYDQHMFLSEQSTPNRVRSNSYNSHPGSTPDVGPLAHVPSEGPDHIDGLHKHHSPPLAPLLPPLSFDISPSMSLSPKEPLTPVGNQPPPLPEKSLFSHPNSSAPVLSAMTSSPLMLTHRSATTPTSKRLMFAQNLSVYDTFPASVYDRRSEPATWSRLTPALAQRIKEELNSYKMEEMEVHSASRIHTQFFV